MGKLLHTDNTCKYMRKSVSCSCYFNIFICLHQHRHFITYKLANVGSTSTIDFHLYNLVHKVAMIINFGNNQDETKITVQVKSCSRVS